MGELCYRFRCSRIQIKNILLAKGIEIRHSFIGIKVCDPTPEEIAERAAQVRRNALLHMAELSAEEYAYLEYEAARRDTDVATIYMEELEAEKRICQKILSREELKDLVQNCKPDERYFGADDNPFE